MENIISKTILALDNMDLAEIKDTLHGPCKEIPTIKIGLELFLRYGPSVVSELAKEFQKEIFLDLKLHDIPNTVSKSIQSLKGLPIKFLTIHLGGGEDMCEAALISAKRSLPDCQLLGVTFLTSLSENDLLKTYGIKDKNEGFARLLKCATESGLPGIILSPHELELASKWPLLKVTPGIRFEGEESSDQKRVMTPHRAISLGADYLVIGRSLTASPNRNENLTKLKGNS